MPKNASATSTTSARPRASARELAAALRIHPHLAAQVVEVLRASRKSAMDLADAIESSQPTGKAPEATISFTPPMPKDPAELDRWSALYAQRTPEQSNRLTERALRAMRFDWTSHGRRAEEIFCARFKCDSPEDAFRQAIRPWPGADDSLQLVRVGTVRFGKRGPRVRFGKRGKPPISIPGVVGSATPVDLYRLLYLTRPIGLSFDDMYGQGLFRMLSPCRRMGASFYLHKYELASCQLVEAAMVTKPETFSFVDGGIPGGKNYGDYTKDPDALRWFSMIDKALRRTWDVYPGNKFRV